MKILVPTAGPVPTKEKTYYIVNIAKRLGAELSILYVMKEKEQAKKGEEAANLFSEAGKNVQVSVTKILKKGDIVSTIIDFAEEKSADLIIMGTHGRTGLKHIVMGSVAEKVVRYSPQPVLTIKRHDYHFDMIPPDMLET